MKKDSTIKIEESARKSVEGGSHQGVKEPSISPEATRVLRLLVTNEYTKVKIAKHLSISRKNLYKHINNLSKNHFYDKQRGVVTQGGYTFLSIQRTSTNSGYRSHGFECYYMLPVDVNKGKWNKFRGGILSRNKLQWDERVLKSHNDKVTGKGMYFFYHKLQACCWENGVYVWFPSEVADTPSASAKLQIDRVVEYGNHLSKLFKMDFIKDNCLNVQLRKSEIAHLDDAYAQELHNAKKKLFVHVNGKLRVVCDFSNNIAEWETMTVGHGVTDHHAMETYKDDIAKKGNIKKYTQELTKDDTQADYVKDIITHKPEEMPNLEKGIFLPSEVVGMFGEQAKRNAEMTANLTRMAEIFMGFGTNVERYGQQIDKHLEMVDNVSALASVMAVQGKASTNLVSQLSRVVEKMTGGKWKPRKTGQKELGSYLK